MKKFIFFSLFTLFSCHHGEINNSDTGYGYKTTYNKIPTNNAAVNIFDLREDIYDVDDQIISNQFNSVAAIFNVKRIKKSGKFYKMDLKTYQDEYKLCSTVDVKDFINQPSGARCTAFLVGPNIMATANHCIQNINLKKLKFVFGYDMIDENTPNSGYLDNNRHIQITVPEDNVYTGIEVIKKDSKVRNPSEGKSPDWAFIKLDRDVKNRKPLSITPDKVKESESIYMIGYPSGLPSKYAQGGKVFKLEDFYFYSNLDAFGGNSGSPVFRESDNAVVGILVRAEQGFSTIKDNKGIECRKPEAVYPWDDNYAKEEATYSFEFYDDLTSINKKKENK